MPFCGLNPFKILDGIKSGSCGRNLNFSSSPHDSLIYPELRKSPACLVDFPHLVWHARLLTSWPPLTPFHSSPISVSGNNTILSQNSESCLCCLPPSIPHSQFTARFRLFWKTKYILSLSSGFDVHHHQSDPSRHSLS